MTKEDNILYKDIVIEVINNKDIRISYIELKKFFNKEELFLNALSEIRRNNLFSNINKNEDLTNYKFNVDEVLSILSVSNKEIFINFYKFLIDNKLNSNISLILLIKYHNLINNKDYLLDDYKDLVNEIDINSNISNYHDEYSDFIISENDVYWAINKIKDKFVVSNDFGKLKNDDILDDLFADLLLNYDDVSDIYSKELEIAKFIYVYIKYEPFIDGNKEILLLLILRYCDEYDLLYRNGIKQISNYDILNAINFISNHINDNKLAINEGSKFLINRYNHIENKNNYLDIIKNSKTKEGVIESIISYFENFNYRFGFYDYYKDCIKIHYSNTISNLKLDVSKSLASTNILYFKGDGILTIEAPSNYNNRFEFINNLVVELKERSKKEFEKIYKKDLLNVVKDFDGIKDFKIKFYINYKIIIDN